ncbi:hypothetical protein WAX74_15100 [Psychrobacillus sp. FJAT-51614]|uniref:Permease n=1 Tax=Psychrobacillus mangrovi TaxID=3117745 RepID=A0ABU8F7H4_9BACI
MSHVIIRKLVSAVIACVLVMLIFFLEEQTGFVMIIGMYLLPILLFYGIPASILSDIITTKLSGLLRGSLALFIHLFLAALFIVIPILFSELERDLLLADIRSLYDNFYFITSLLSSSLFWCIDEVLRSKRVKVLSEKNGNLRI